MGSRDAQQIVDREAVRRLVEQGAQLVDVLDPEEFADSHLPGARNIPLRMIDRDAKTLLSRDAPIVVYCNDYA